MAEEGSGPPPIETDAAASENLTLQQIADREARKGSASAPPAPKLPPFVGNLTPAQLKEKSRGIASLLGFLVGAWLCYGVGGALASLAIRRFLLERETGLDGWELVAAQLLLAAPYLVVAFGSGAVLRSKPAIPRPQTACLVMAVVFAIARLHRFEWCGTDDPTAAVLARIADAGARSLATYLGFGIRRSEARSDMERFGPGPIEP